MEYNGEQESSGLIERTTIRSLFTKTQQNYIDPSAKRVALQAGINVHLSVCENSTFFLETTQIHSFSSLSYDRSKASSKVNCPHSAS